MNQERFDWIFEHIVLRVYGFLITVTGFGILILEIWIRLFK